MAAHDTDVHSVRGSEDTAQTAAVLSG
jgi:hypothetical protein